MLKSGWLISSGLRAGPMKIEALSQQTSPQTVLCPCLAAKLFSDLLSGFWTASPSNYLVVCVSSKLIKDNLPGGGTWILRTIFASVRP